MAMTAVAGFFALKMLVGMALVVQSARSLSVAEFGVFSQIFLFFALLSTVSAGGVQNGLIRQVASAGDDLARERRSVAAALVMWAGFSAIILVLALVAAEPLSELLVGSSRAAGTIPILAAAALAAGGGQVLCAVLTGRDRPATSLALQGVGLALGGIGCWIRLAAGDAQGAVMAYAMGPVISLIAAVPLAWRWLPHELSAFRRLGAELRLLLGFSGTFLLTATVMPATLIALRYAYRLEFGDEVLGYWLAANRVSDVTSQLLGLYMAQVYLPAATRMAGRNEILPLARRTAAMGLALTGAGLALFVLFAAWFVKVFLSASFVPAIPFIVGYLVGDTLRVVTSLSLHTALARGKLSLYAGTEAATAGFIALYVLALIGAGRIESAYWGYAAAHATMAALALLGWRKGVWSGVHGSVGG